MTDGPVILSGDRRRTLAEILARAMRAAEGFRAAGVREGDAVALFMRNDFAFFEASMGAMFAGAYAVPLNWHSTVDEAGYVLRDCGARILVVHGDLLATIAPAIPVEMQVVVVATPPEIAAAYRVAPGAPARTGHPAWEDWLAGHAPIAYPDAAHRAALVYTSGTTGKPKGVRRDADREGRLLAKAQRGYILDGPGPKTVLTNGPMYHTAPNFYGRAAILAGADLVLQPRFDAEEMLALIERHRISHMHVVPTMFVRLLRLPEQVRARYDLGSLRAVVHGAAPCPPAVQRAMIEWWGPVIHQYYGSSETGLVTGHDSAEALRKPGTVGRAFPDVTIRILGSDGAIMPAGESGDIYVRSVAQPDFTYLGLADQRAEIDRDGFVTVGDVGYLDEDGYLFLSDRRRDMIISGGVNIYSAEIEAALLALDEVADCAVFAIPDAEFGEAVCAYLQPQPQARRAIDKDKVRKRLTATLSSYKIPKVIEVVDKLPREDSGKIFKRKLRDPYWPRQSH